MGNPQARVATAATVTAIYLAWHLTSGMYGTVIRLHTPGTEAAVTTSALTTSQCQDLPAAAAPSPSAAASPSPSPSTSTASAGKLCISVQASQDNIPRGNTATWTIQVTADGGTATAVTITVSAGPSGPVPVFTGSCPSGGGSAACTVGDMNTAITPSSYQLQAQVTVPAETTARTLTLTASADTNPAMTAAPAAGQDISITGTLPVKTSPKAAPKPSTTPRPARTAAASNPAPVQPATPPATAPAIGALPTIAAVTTTVPPGSVSTVLPQITPAATVASTPAANIQAVGSSPTASTAGADSFTLSIGMSARTAEVLGFILLALIFTLTTAKLTSSYINGHRQGAHHSEPASTSKQDPVERRPRWLCLPRARKRPGRTRAERTAARERNWRHYLETRRQQRLRVTS
jgi:hypothetical protein